MFKKLCVVISTVVFGASVSLHATELKVRDDYPEEYIVKKGDTLWDISETFLATPWLWPQLWQANPQVNNPHLIYPGDRLYLRFIDGKPVLTKKKRVRLSPDVRVVERDNAIPTLPLSLVEPYFKREQVVTPEQLEQLPVILGNNDGFKRGYNSQLWYAGGTLESDAKHYGVYRIEEQLIRPVANELLGVRMVLVATADVYSSDKENIHTVEVEGNKQELQQGDRLIPLSPHENLALTFQPSAPEAELTGHVIATHTGSRFFAAHDTVIVDLGSNDGIKPGHVLSIMKTGKPIVDQRGRPVYAEDTGHYQNAKGSLQHSGLPTLPNEVRGTLMVFRTFDAVSYGMVMETNRPLNLLDKVQTPQ